MDRPTRDALRANAEAAKDNAGHALLVDCDDVIAFLDAADDRDKAREWALEWNGALREIAALLDVLAGRSLAADIVPAVRALLAERDRLREVLASVEWVADPGHPSECPVCGGVKPGDTYPDEAGHRSPCALDAALHGDATNTPPGMKVTFVMPPDPHNWRFTPGDTHWRCPKCKGAVPNGEALPFAGCSAPDKPSAEPINIGGVIATPAEHHARAMTWLRKVFEFLPGDAIYAAAEMVDVIEASVTTGPVEVLGEYHPHRPRQGFEATLRGARGTITASGKDAATLGANLLAEAKRLGDATGKEPR